MHKWKMPVEVKLKEGRKAEGISSRPVGDLGYEHKD